MVSTTIKDPISWGQGAAILSCHRHCRGPVSPIPTLPPDRKDLRGTEAEEEGPCSRAPRGL